MRSFNKYTKEKYPKYMVVIGGGSAVNYYFRDEIMPIFKTHDFDLRLVYNDVLPTNIVEYSKISNTMNTLRSHLMNKFTEELNFAIKNPEIIKILNEFYQKKISLNPNFKFYKRDNTPYNTGEDLFYTNASKSYFNLANVFYKYSIGGAPIDAAIVDCILYNHQWPHYGYYNKDLINNKDLNIYEMYDIYHQNGGEGFFKNILITKPELGIYNLVEDKMEGEGSLYYLGLGFLIWDTVRMLNWSAKNRSSKYLRYMEKYKELLDCLNKPSIGLRCNSETLKEYYESCSEKIHFDDYETKDRTSYILFDSDEKYDAQLSYWNKIEKDLEIVPFWPQAAPPAQAAPPQPPFNFFDNPPRAAPPAQAAPPQPPFNWPNSPYKF
jgi:hypothetical protein